MYFATRTSRGKQILQLLESYRNADGQPRNRVVLSLGMRELDKSRGKLIAQVGHRCGTLLPPFAADGGGLILALLGHLNLTFLRARWGQRASSLDLLARLLRGFLAPF
ncbi:MAG: hypothetical protein ACI8W8_004815, partial [Rhodothermales bacterium]